MKRQSTFAIVAVATALALAACSATTLKQLKAAKRDYQQGALERLADKPVDCKPSAEGCNQLHLIKGDACYRLAKQRSDARRYECATTHIQAGIAQTREWRSGDLDLSRAQTYENLAESLRNWQDLEQGDQATRLTMRLRATADEFLRVEPGHPAAMYFLASADLALLRPAILHPERAPSVCADLQAIRARLTSAAGAASGTRYAPHVAALIADLAGAQQAVGTCH